jgi:choline dehydrogenase-like flavoprotein
MATPDWDRPQYDVVIVGCGVAGAVAAAKLAEQRVRVLLIEAGGVANESLGRRSLAANFATSSSKTPDTPFCGGEVLAPQPDLLQAGRNYYEYDTDPKTKGDDFKSYYERLVGGSTWHWQGLYLRMLPNDFQMQRKYGVGLDWPLTYAELEPWYVAAEYEMGVAGSDKEVDEFFGPRFGAYRSKRFPMPELVPSWLDAVVANAVNGKEVPGLPNVALRVTSVPHATNSKPYDGRPACNGHTSCVPLCPIRARYDAMVHVERALALGADLRTHCVATKLELDASRQRVSRVWYQRWRWDPAQARQVPSGAPEWVGGRIVILAANGIENPMLLLRSGVANASDAVGRHLMDHPIKQSYALTAKPVYPFRGPLTTSGIEVFRDGDFRRQYAAFKTSLKNDGWSTNKTGAPVGYGLSPATPHDNTPGTILDFVGNRNYFGSKLKAKLVDHATRQLTLNSACEQLPHKDNRITLSANSRDPFGLERPHIHYSVDDGDGYVSKSFAAMIKVHARVFDLLGIPEADRFMQNDGVVTYSGSGHIMGTTIMGNDRRTSVVDKHCRAHDVANLYILGSSVFPTGSTANSTSTIGALALRAADTIAKDLRAKP